jgi:hypothetical protein
MPLTRRPREQANELIALATDQCFPYWRAQGVIYRGWVSWTPKMRQLAKVEPCP